MSLGSKWILERWQVQMDDVSKTECARRRFRMVERSTGNYEKCYYPIKDFDKVVKLKEQLEDFWRSAKKQLLKE